MTCDVLQHNSEIPVNGPLLQEKAQELNTPNLNCSMISINLFKVRYNIVFGKIIEESLEFNVEI